MGSDDARRAHGWYPDPDDGELLRFWDGGKWTQLTKSASVDDGTGPADPLLAPPGAAPTSWTTTPRPASWTAPPTPASWTAPPTPAAVARGALHALIHPHRYSGRAGRVEYWGFIVLAAVVVLGAAAATSPSHSQVAPDILAVVLFPSLMAATVRRLHDTDRPGTTALYSLVPLIGGLWVWSYCLAPGDQGANTYGPPPN